MLSNVLLLALNLAGAAIAAAVVAPLLEIASMVRSTALRRQWHALTLMLACVVVLMLAVAATIRETPDITAFATAGSYTLGAVFLMGVVLLARNTARETLRLDALEQAAFVDSLTGLGNRRRFDERLSEEIRRAGAAALPLSLLVLDVDHFKHINDSYGHAVGDLILEQIAAVVGANSRRTDTPCRVGGEEFAVIMPGLDSTYAAVAAEQLRRAIGETVSPNGVAASIRVTASLGLASLRSGETAALLFRRADAALYDAKRNGRDQMNLAA